MATLKHTTSADRLHDVYGVFLDLQLGNDPGAAQIRPEWQADQASLQQANDAWKESLHEQLTIRSRRVWERPKLRNAIRTFANTLVEMGNGSRKTVLYRSYFPDGYAAISRRNLGDQIAAAKSILYRLESEENESLRAEGDALRAAVESAEEVETAWQESIVTVAERKDALDKAKLVWLAAYRRVHGELTALHASNPSIVSVFFLNRQRRSRSSESTPESNETGSPESPASVNGSSASQNGVAENGAPRDGATQNGAPQNGASRDRASGTSQNGASTSGSDAPAPGDEDGSTTFASDDAAESVGSDR